MKTFVGFRFVTIFISWALFSSMALGMSIEHEEPNTNEWGYIRIDNRAGFGLSTKCYTKDGKGSSRWKKANSGGFRSCHGAYMRVDTVVNTYRFWRSQCGDKGLYVKITGSLFNIYHNLKCE